MNDDAATKQAAIKRKPSGLGRGLGALMGEVRREEPLVAQSAASDADERPGAAIPGRFSGGLSILAIAELVVPKSMP